MRHIAQLESSKIPRDDEFKFKDRAQALVNKWHGMIDKHGTNGTTEAAAINDAMLIDKTDGEAELNKIRDTVPPVDITTGTTDVPMDTKMDISNENHTVNDAMEAEADVEDEKGTLGDLTMSEA